MSHDIHLHHITRVEGHGNLVLDIKRGVIKELRLEIVESPRFFEVMLQGRKADEAPYITSRICGICAISHTTASIKACEASLCITPSAGTILLRKLLANAEVLQSHILHIYLLAAPDFFGVGSIIPLIATDPEMVRRALRLKKTANEICRIVAGRHVHPVGMVLGGFKKTPGREDLKKIESILTGAVTDIDETVRLFERITLPEFNRENTFVSLRNEEEYNFYDGDIYSVGDDPVGVRDYKKVIKEEVIEYSTAKHARRSGKSIMVGALARLNNNFDLLGEEAVEAAERLGFIRGCSNPFMNTVAQVIESVHCIYDSLRLVKMISANLPISGAEPVRLASGCGVGAVEAPRGTLYHEYEIDADGSITKANCIIPTAQNLANIEEDIRMMVPQILHFPKSEIVQRLEMLVRSYDPCISCSTHMLEVTFV